MGDPAAAVSLRDSIDDAAATAHSPAAQRQRVENRERLHRSWAVIRDFINRRPRDANPEANTLPFIDTRGDTSEVVTATRVHSLDPDPVMVEFADVTPGLDVIQKSRNVEILDGAGEKRKFGDVLDELRRLQAKKLMVIFIRHFFCGSCQDYIRAVSQAFSGDSLPEGSKIYIVGIGSHTLIDHYRNATGCPFPIYTEPKGELVEIFAMRRSLSLGPGASSYSSQSIFSLVLSGIYQTLGRLWMGDAHKAGNPTQNGGEILFEFEQAPGGEGVMAIRSTWCHIMKHTRDHSSITCLRHALALEDSD